MADWIGQGNALSFGVESADVREASLSATGGGGFQMLWTQNNGGADVSGSSVWGQVYGSGLSAYDAFLVNGTTAGDQRASATAVLGSGWYANVWLDASGTADDPGTGIKSRWYYGTGPATGYEARVNNGVAGDQVDPSVIALSLFGDRYAVAWTDLATASGAGVRVQVFDGRTRVETTRAVGRGELLNDEATLLDCGADGFILVWRERASAGATESLIRGQRFTFSGYPDGDAFDIGAGIGDVLADPSIAALTDGRLVVSWNGRDGDGSVGVRARILTADGLPDSAIISGNSHIAGAQHDAVLTALADGGFGLVWTDDAGNGQDVRGQLFDNGGVKFGVETLIAGGAGDQYDASVVTLTGGEKLIAWTDRSADGDRDVNAQRFALAAAPVAPGTAGDDTITGSANVDVIDGLAGNDVIRGSAGGDTIAGGDGDDRLSGDDGDDIVTGGAGNDVLTDSTIGNDLLDGGIGDDTITVTRSHEPAKDMVTLIGGEGNDTLIYSYSSSVITMDAGAGDDLIRLFMNNSDATITLGTGTDTVRFEQYFPDYFRAPTVRITDFVAGNGGDVIDLTQIVGADAFRTGQLVLRQNGADVELAGHGDGSSIIVVVAVFANTTVDQFTPYNFSGMGFPATLTLDADGITYSNDAALIGQPAVAITGDDVRFFNLAAASVTKAQEGGASDPGAAAIVITGSGAVIENRAGASITAQDGAGQAILGSANADIVRNFGLVQGVVRLGGGADDYFELVRESNSLGGRTIDLGDGDDHAELDVSTLGELLNLTVLGGAGTDRVDITGIAGNQTVRVNTAAGVETLGFAGAAGSVVTLTRNATLTADLAVGAGVRLVIPDSVFSGSVYVGPATGTVHLNGGAIDAGPNVAFAAIIGSDAADRVTLSARLVPPSQPATATGYVDLAGGDDLFVFSYGNTAPLSVNGGAGNDRLDVSQFDERLDLSAFRGFETISHALAISRTPVVPFILTGISSDTRTLLIDGFARDNPLLLDLGNVGGLAIGLNDEHVMLAAGTIIASIADHAVLDRKVAATDQWIENHGTILGNVRLGAGDDRFANAADGMVLGIVAGGIGNDTYVVDAAYRLTERAGEGTDTVISSIAYRLGSNIEALVLTGGGAINGYGNPEANALTGNDAANRLYGLAGDDRIAGGGGNDVLDGGPGADAMAGGAGDDSYRVDQAGDSVYEDTAAGIDTVTSTIDYILGANVEKLLLAGAARVGTGNALDNIIYGTAGADRLSGLDGRDTLQGLDGGDILFGGAGGDVLVGGAGRDVMTGGAGADRFVFRAGDSGGRGVAADQITDFSQADGDRISLEPIDANSATPSDDAFVLTDRFHGVAGEVFAAVLNGFTFIHADTDGDAISDLDIRLTGEIILTASNFVL